LEFAALHQPPQTFFALDQWKLQQIEYVVHRLTLAAKQLHKLAPALIVQAANLTV
jgi:hypothetical protein